ncbi:MAG: hemolysin family protein [Planctomycetota bacterium]
MSELLSEEYVRLAVMAGLVVFSAFFSGSETALFSLGREELESLRRRHRRRGAAAARLLAAPEGLLTSILFGNLVVNTLYFSLGAGLTARASELSGRSVGAALGAVVLVVLILFGEILPKALAAGSPGAISSAVSIPLWLFHGVLGRPAGVVASPVLAAVNRLARPGGAKPVEPDELRMLVELAGRSGALTGPEAEMIDSVVELSEMRVREVMVPRVDVIFASVADRPEQALRRLAARDRSRAPVYDGPIDNIVGVVEAGDLLAALAESAARASDLRGFLKPVEFIPESARLAAVLGRVRDEGFGVAVAVDEYGGTAGLLTLEDLAGTVTGDLGGAGAELPGVDEAGQTRAEAPDVERTASGSYILSGDLSVREWAELFDVEPEPGQFDRLGGFVISLLGRIPQPGDVARWGNLRFVVREMTGRRVSRVELSLEENRK